MLCLLGKCRKACDVHMVLIRCDVHMVSLRSNAHMVSLECNVHMVLLRCICLHGLHLHTKQ